MDQIDALKREIEHLRRDSNTNAEYLLQGELGNFYFAQRNLLLAANFYKEALETARSMHNLVGEGATLSNLGNVYAEQGEIRDAITLYEEALKIARDVEDRQLEGNTLNNLGLAYGKLGDEMNAKQCYQHALQIAKEVDDQELRGNILSNLQLAYGEQENQPQATQNISLPVYENKYKAFSLATDSRTPTDAFTQFLSQQRRSISIFFGCISALALIEAIVLMCHLQRIIPSSWSLLLDTVTSVLSITLSLSLCFFLWFLYGTRNRPLNLHSHNVHQKIDS